MKLLLVCLYICNLFIQGFSSVCEGIRDIKQVYSSGLLGFKVKKVALRSVSCSLPPESIISFIGPSGSGKSTLARLIARLEIPFSGFIQYQLDPKNIVGCLINRSSTTGLDNSLSITELLKQKIINLDSRYIFNEIFFSLFEENGIDSNVPLFSLSESRRKKSEILFAIILALVNCEDFSNKQSCGVILVLDEYLDKDHSNIIKEIALFLRKLATNPIVWHNINGISKIIVQILIITHSQKVFLPASDYCVSLTNGIIFDCNVPDKVMFVKNIDWI
jgi:ABC-type oligopeptide transport system ATPase subunit